MSDYQKRDPAGVPSEVNKMMWNRLFGEARNNDARRLTEGDQHSPDSSSDSDSGSRDSNRIPSAQLIANAPDMLAALQMAYRKHHLGDESIGWDELSEKLLNVLCEAMGDDEFVKWTDEVAPCD